MISRIEQVLKNSNVQYDFIDNVRVVDDDVFFDLWINSTSDIGPFKDVKCLKKATASIKLDKICTDDMQ